MSKNRKWTDEELVSAVKNNYSIRQTLLSLGLCGRGGGSYRAVQKRIKDLDIDTSHMTGMAWLKGKTYEGKKRYSDEEVFVENSTFSSKGIKDRLKKYFKYECHICGLKDWQHKKITLQIDHINGINDDNRLENLRFLCPNCHSQTPTFAGRNKIGSTGVAPARPQGAESFEDPMSAVPSRAQKNQCVDCSKNISKYCLRCKSCAGKIRENTKIDWPPVEELVKLVSETSYLAVGRKLGISDNAIRKRIKKYSQ